MTNMNNRGTAARRKRLTFDDVTNCVGLSHSEMSDDWKKIEMGLRVSVRKPTLDLPPLRVNQPIIRSMFSTKNALEDLCRKEDDLRREYHELESMSDHYRTGIIQYQTQIKLMQLQHKMLKDQFSAAQTELEERKKSFASFQDNCKSSLESQQSQLLITMKEVSNVASDEEKWNNVSRYTEELKSKLDHCKAQLSIFAQSIKNDSNGANATSNATNDSSVNAANVTKYSDLQKLIEVVSQKQRTSETQFQNLNLRCKQLTEENKQLLDSNDRLQKNCDELRGNTISDQQKMTTSIARLENEVKQLQMRAKILTEQMVTLDSLNRKRTQQNREICWYATAAHAELTEKVMEIEGLRRANEVLQSKYNDLKSLYNRVQSDGIEKIERIRLDHEENATIELLEQQLKDEKRRSDERCQQSAKEWTRMHEIHNELVQKCNDLAKQLSEVQTGFALENEQLKAELRQKHVTIKHTPRINSDEMRKEYESKMEGVISERDEIANKRDELDIQVTQLSDAVHVLSQTLTDGLYFMQHAQQFFNNSHGIKDPRLDKSVDKLLGFVSARPDGARQQPSVTLQHNYDTFLTTSPSTSSVDRKVRRGRKRAKPTTSVSSTGVTAEQNSQPPRQRRRLNDGTSNPAASASTSTLDEKLNAGRSGRGGRRSSRRKEDVSMADIHSENSSELLTSHPQQMQKAFSHTGTTIVSRYDPTSTATAAANASTAANSAVGGAPTNLPAPTTPSSISLSGIVAGQGTGHTSAIISEHHSAIDPTHAPTATPVSTEYVIRPMANSNSYQAVRATLLTTAEAASSATPGSAISVASSASTLPNAALSGALSGGAHSGGAHSGNTLPNASFRDAPTDAPPQGGVTLIPSLPTPPQPIDMSGGEVSTPVRYKSPSNAIPNPNSNLNTTDLPSSPTSASVSAPPAAPTNSTTAATAAAVTRSDRATLHRKDDNSRNKKKRKTTAASVAAASQQSNSGGSAPHKRRTTRHSAKTQNQQNTVTNQSHSQINKRRKKPKIKKTIAQSSSATSSVALSASSSAVLELKKAQSSPNDNLSPNLRSNGPITVSSGSTASSTPVAGTEHSSNAMPTPKTSPQIVVRTQHRKLSTPQLSSVNRPSSAKNPSQQPPQPNKRSISDDTPVSTSRDSSHKNEKGSRRRPVGRPRKGGLGRESGHNHSSRDSGTLSNSDSKEKDSERASSSSSSGSSSSSSSDDALVSAAVKIQTTAANTNTNTNTNQPQQTASISLADSLYASQMHLFPMELWESGMIEERAHSTASTPQNVNSVSAMSVANNIVTGDKSGNVVSGVSGTTTGDEDSEDDSFELDIPDTSMGPTADGKRYFMAIRHGDDVQLLAGDCVAIRRKESKDCYGCIKEIFIDANGARKFSATVFVPSPEKFKHSKYKRRELIQLSGTQVFPVRSIVRPAWIWFPKEGMDIDVIDSKTLGRDTFFVRYEVSPNQETRRLKGHHTEPPESNSSPRSAGGRRRSSRRR